MPTTHLSLAAFLAFSAASGGSSGCGCVIGVSHRLRAVFPRVHREVLWQGCAHAAVLRPDGSEGGLIFVNAHLEPASPLAARTGVVDNIADLVQQYDRCVPVAAGDWNSVHADDPRIDLRRLEEVSGYDPLAVHFERKLSDFVELEQMAPTRCQMPDGVSACLCSDMPGRNGRAGSSELGTW